jgi:4-aminobutyrate aminotransferase
MAKLHKSEGDINISPQREAWQKKHLDTKSRALLDEDARYFLKQSLSTPCLNTMQACEGIYIEDLQGRRYMDFHGNNVHQVGFGNPEVIAAVKKQLDALSFCTRRYTNQVAVDLARKLAEIFTAPLWIPYPSAARRSSVTTWGPCFPAQSTSLLRMNIAVCLVATTVAAVI